MNNSTNLQLMTPNLLFKYPRFCLLMGQSGTGKSTFLAYLYEQWLKTKKDSVAIWLLQESVGKRAEGLFPEMLKDRTITISDPLDDLWSGGEGSKYFDIDKLLISDETAKIIDKYSNAEEITTTFGHLLGVHRPKRTFVIMTDQADNFIFVGKQIRHWYIFTGASDSLGKKLFENATWYVQKWFQYYTPMLIQLSEFNRESLKENGKGLAIITNGIQTFAMIFKRPSFFTMEFSEIYKYLRKEDIGVKSDSTDESLDYSFDSPYHHALMFAWHVAKYDSDKIVKEDFDSIYRKISPVFFGGSVKKLTDKGRAAVKQASHFCGTNKCPFCVDREYFLEKLQDYEESLDMNLLDNQEPNPELTTQINTILRKVT